MLDAGLRAERETLKKLAASEQLPAYSSEKVVLLAMVLKDLRELTAAIDLLRRAQQKHPNDFWINELLGLGLSEMNPPENEESLRFLSVAFALRPDSTAASHNLGNALADVGRVDEAIAHVRTALLRMKEFPKAHNALGAFFCDRKHDYDAAIAAFLEAIRLKPDWAEAHFNLGNAFKGKSLLDKAIAEYRCAIQLKKDYPEAHAGLGDALRKNGQLDRAIAEYREAARLGQNTACVLNNLGRALVQLGQLDLAEIEFQRALRIAKDELKRKHSQPSVYHYVNHNLGVIRSLRGDFQAAIPFFEEAIRVEPDFADAHSSLGGALQDLGKLDEAITECREAIRLNPNSADCHNNLGWALQEKGRFEEAIREYRKALELEPKDAHAHNNLRKAEQLAALDKRLPAVLTGKDQPKDAAERLGFAWLCVQYLKQYAAAARFYAEAFAAEPKLAKDLQNNHRYNPACAAALAGCGEGKDADQTDDKERARLRSQALDWLNADVAAYRQALDKEADKAKPVLQHMQHWQQDKDFAGVRGDGLNKLPEAERQAWQRLWEDVEALRQRAAEPAKKAGS
jgi:tetratricopeptide (TPR) repeat protein